MKRLVVIMLVVIVIGTIGSIFYSLTVSGETSAKMNSDDFQTLNHDSSSSEDFNNAEQTVDPEQTGNNDDYNDLDLAKPPKNSQQKKPDFTNGSDHTDNNSSTVSTNNKSVSTHKIPTTQKQSSAAASLPRGLFITVDKTNFVLTLYNDGKVVKKYPVAIGRHTDYTETPEGKFKIISKVVNPQYYAENIPGGAPNNPLGTRWIGLNAGIRVQNSIGIHGNIEEGAVETAASDGCIRLDKANIEDLYTRVKTNLAVWIGSEEKLRDWGVTP